ncbi:MAG: alpha/beta hydrolase [Synergistaceae bacterium]|jgi:pimeloyl-ACP methyl ester carboxylesterase|nr:alpha/beta hydrolase [Synergistaceae bacterium]
MGDNELSSIQQDAYEPGILPEGIRSRFVNANGLRMHILEAGYETPARPCVLLLHGFPELAYTWRRNMLPLADRGFHVIAPDQRGFGRTTGWAYGYDVDLHPFGMLNLVTDAVSLVTAIGYRRVHAVVGHDSGAMVAAYSALIRPDIFHSLVMMAAPFPGIPEPALGVEGWAAAFQDDPIHEALCALEPPRKHYQLYYSSAEADVDLHTPQQGLHAFLRAYFHVKSADWKQNRPYRLNSQKADELAKMPTYYIMERDKDMAATVHPYMPGQDEVNACTWLTERELKVYSSEYARTGFQGSLNSYRCGSIGLNTHEMRLFAGRTIDVPALYIAGRYDWSTYLRPGFLEAMSQCACTDFRGSYFVDNAGHWVQQEQSGKTNDLLLRFL